MPRRGSALIAFGMVIMLAAALLPGTALFAFDAPALSFTVLTFVWRMPLPVDVVLPVSADAPAPLDTRGPPASLLA